MKKFFTLISLLLIGCVSGQAENTALARIAPPPPAPIIKAPASKAPSLYEVPTSQEAVAFVKDLVQKGQEVANRPGDHQQEFGELLRDNFVTDEIAKFVLGSKWRSMAAEQRARFQKIYEKRLVKINSDSEKVNTFRDSTPTIFEAATPQIDGSVLVKSDFTSKSKPNDPPAKIGFKVVKKSGLLKILDILFENVSKLIAERNEYGSIWSQQGNDPERFLKFLESTL